MTVKCEHCGKEYKSEGKHYKNHVETCPIHYRKQILDTPHGFNAFEHWQYDRRFFSKKSNTKEKFMNSRDFLIYAELSIWLFERKCPDMKSFTEFVSDKQINYRYWKSDETYAKWMSHFYTTIDLHESMCLSLRSADEWSKKYDRDWTEFLNEARPETILQYLESFKLSPWYIFINNAYGTIESRCEERQKKMLKFYADPNIWLALIVKNKKQVDEIAKLMG